MEVSHIVFFLSLGCSLFSGILLINPFLPSKALSFDCLPISCLNRSFLVGCIPTHLFVVVGLFPVLWGLCIQMTDMKKFDPVHSHTISIVLEAVFKSLVYLSWSLDME